MERGYSSLVRRKLRMGANREGSLSMKICTKAKGVQEGPTGGGDVQTHRSGLILQGGDASAQQADRENTDL